MLNLDGDLHGIEAIDAELHERGFARIIAFRERPLDLFLDDLGNGSLGLGLHLRDIELGGRWRWREFVRGWPEKEVAGDEGGSFSRCIRVVPLLQPEIEGCTRRLG